MKLIEEQKWEIWRLMVFFFHLLLYICALLLSFQLFRSCWSNHIHFRWTNLQRENCTSDVIKICIKLKVWANNASSVSLHGRVEQNIRKMLWLKMTNNSNNATIVCILCNEMLYGAQKWRTFWYGRCFICVQFHFGNFINWFRGTRHNVLILTTQVSSGDTPEITKIIFFSSDTFLLIELCVQAFDSENDTHIKLTTQTAYAGCELIGILYLLDDEKWTEGVQRNGRQR